MITFKGTQKEFFRAYPLNMRNSNEIYELENTDGKTQYQFIGGLGEKCFKKIDSGLIELTRLKSVFSTFNEDDIDFVIQKLQEVVMNAKSWSDFVNEKVISLLNKINVYAFYWSNDEDDWNFYDDFGKHIASINKHVNTDVLYNKNHKLYAMKSIDEYEIEILARFCDELRTCCPIMKSCKTLLRRGFDITFNVDSRINKLIRNLKLIDEGYINFIDEVVEDYKWFGETFSNFRLYKGGPTIRSKFANMSFYLSKLYTNYHEKLDEFEN